MVDYVSHVEIPVLNLEKAKSWYYSIFKWKIDIDSFPDYGLTYFEDYKTSIGFFKVDRIPEKGINVVFEVANIEQKLLDIEEAGGKIIREKYLISEEVGYAAQFQDIFGNELGLHART
ncbi:MAG: VOC family protein [Candidatus Thorarchaeota archaeon]